MAKQTLLQLVQAILSAMDSDAVNSIGDTPEALQVAREVQVTYDALVAPLDIPEHEQLRTLQGLSDTTRPNYLTYPDDVKSLRWLRYNHGTIASPNWVTVQWMEPEDFLAMVLNITDDMVQVPNLQGVNLPCATNKGPEYWTTFDDTYIITDSYNSTLDDTLHEAKTMAMCWTSPEFRLEDTFVPNLDASLFPLLLAQATSACFINIKQVSNANSEYRAQRLLNRSQDKLRRNKQPEERYPDYGR